MLQKKNFLFYGLLLFTIHSFAQTDNSPVKIKLDKNNSGDSLWITVTVNTYTKPASLMFTASLENSTARDTFFLPVIDSVAVYCLVFPATIKKNLLLQSYFSPGTFKISGTVNNVKNQTAIRAILITDNEKIFNKELALKNGNEFSLPSMVFENKASLAFNYPTAKNKGKDHPDISLTITPETAGFTNLVFSDIITRVEEQKFVEPGRIIKVDSAEERIVEDDKYKTLGEVKVTGTKKSSIEKFNEAYSSGLFKDASEKVIDCIDNNNILSYPDCLSYLQSKIPGIRISIEGGEDMTVTWRGHEMKAFYIDEIAVDIDQVLGMNTADIAMLKVYPPPFTGSSSGDGGAVAVYTRRGEYRKAKDGDKKWLFTVKGYSSPIRILFEGNK